MAGNKTRGGGGRAGRSGITSSARPKRITVTMERSAEPLSKTGEQFRLFRDGFPLYTGADTRAGAVARAKELFPQSKVTVKG